MFRGIKEAVPRPLASPETLGRVTDLSTRYGSRQRPRWLWPVVTAAGIAIGVAFAAWVGFQKEPVSAQVWGYEVLDDNQVIVKLDVVRPDPIDVTCTVYAQAFDQSIVGEKAVVVPPSERKVVRVEIPIETERRAVTGVLRTCVPVD